ncbi:MAG: sodium/proline symporter [Pseudomonadota bacterium]
MILATFIIVLTIIVLSGLRAGLKSGKDQEGYYLAGANSPPWLTAFAAAATLNSGYVFTGFIGFTYLGGLQTIWLSVGWILGDFIASLFIYKQLRVARDRTDQISFAAVLGTWNGGNYKWFRRLAALITVIFLSLYASAQIAAGGKALFATVDIDPTLGALITVGLVLGYGALGGVGASMWANAMQFIVMLCAMAILVVTALSTIGGFGVVVETLGRIEGYLTLWPETGLAGPLTGGVLFIIGWIFAGFSIVGQPHIMTIYMTLEDPEKIKETRVWYYSFYTVFTALAIAAGLLARVLLPELAGTDPELALSTMARDLLPAIFVGVILAGIFSATLSTIDSLVLASSAAITNEVGANIIDKSWKMRALTAIITIGALLIALSGNKSVFSIVIISWSSLGSAFGPIMTVYALRRRLSEISAIFVAIVGVSVALIWREMGLHNDIYEGFPGIGVGLILAWLLSSPVKPPAGKVQIEP